MATQPEFPPPDTIEPHSPPESPPSPSPMEDPFYEPPEIIPEVPDQDYPGRESAPGQETDDERMSAFCESSDIQ